MRRVASSSVLLLLGALLLGAPARAEDPPPGQQGHTADELEAANRAAALLLKERLERDRPGDYERLCRIPARDLLVVRGAYDHVEWVLRQVGVPFRETDPESFSEFPLLGVRVVLVNCPGQVGAQGADRLRRFVHEGGLLFTTDWAVLNVLEPAFPRTVRYTRRPTRDDVVAIRVVAPEHVFLRHVLTGNDDHVWWLETASYPIEVLDRRRVEVLIESEEMRRKYGAGPIAVTFPAGRGRVVHIVSHFYLQRSELRSDRDRLKARAFAEDLGFAPGSPAMRRLAEDGLDETPAGELRTAYAAQQFLANLLIEAVRARGAEPEPPPHTEPGPHPTAVVAVRDTALCEAPGGRTFRAIAAGLRLQVIGRRDAWVEVRTPTGVRGWLPRADVAAP